MNFENLSPELQDKAMACETPEELFALAKEEGIELADEDLERINGGWGGKPDRCRRCGSTNVTLYPGYQSYSVKCNDCGMYWGQTHM